MAIYNYENTTKILEENGFIDSVKNVGSTIANGAKKAGQWYVSNAKENIGAVANGAKKAGQWYVSNAKENISNVANGFNKAVGAAHDVASAAKSGFDKITNG